MTVNTKMTSKKYIVTSFLRYHGKILLFQRSSEVGTYQGRWAGCSGYLEGKEDPLDRAIIEIQEETQLSKDQVTLIKKGELIEIIDEKMGITWVINPFLFEITTNRITIDWEHKTYKWINPDDLRTFLIVPGLIEVYNKVKDS